MRTMYSKIDEFKRRILNDILIKLHMRGNKRRSYEDDGIFYDFNSFISNACFSHLQTIGIDLFDSIDKIVQNFEITNNTQIHKGSIYFNVGILYLWIGDADSALYFCKKAEDEDSKTGGSPSNILNQKIF